MSNSSTGLSARTSELVRIAQLIDRKYLANEVLLMVSKWPNYRFMSLWKATMQFHLEFKRQYAATQPRATEGDPQRGENVGKRLELNRRNPHLTQLWQARQVADVVGMPYSEYLRFCFDFAGRRNRQYSPQPNQLGPNPKTEEAWHSAREAYWTEDRMYLALTSQPILQEYNLANQRALPAQLVFRRDLAAMARNDGVNIVSFIARQVTLLGQMDRSDFPWLSDDLFERHREMAAPDVARGFYTHPGVATVKEDSFLQACFGVPGINRPASTVCNDCAVRADCTALATTVDADLVRLTGSVDPIAERIRQINRKRQKRHRARKKLSTAVANGTANPAQKTLWRLSQWPNRASVLPRQTNPDAVKDAGLAPGTDEPCSPV